MIKVITMNDAKTSFMLLRWITDVATGQQEFAFAVEDLNALNTSLFLQKAGVELTDITRSMMQLRTGDAREAEFLTADDVLWMKQHNTVKVH